MNTPTPAIPAVDVAVGGYRVTIAGATHFVDKSRHCSCGRPQCQAIKAVALYLRTGGKRAPARAEDKPRSFTCPVCGAEARGSLEARNWQCAAAPKHFWQWWADHIRAARNATAPTWSPYTREVLQAFSSNEARSQFNAEHALGYPAQG